MWCNINRKMSITFTTEQKNYLEEYFRNISQKCLDTIMDSEDEFEGTEDSFKGLFNDKFKIDELKVDDSNQKKTKSKRKKREVDPNKPKRANKYLNWIWNEDPDIGMTKIKNDYPELETYAEKRTKASEIWKSFSQQEKDKYN